jgi:hypothetical protein
MARECGVLSVLEYCDPITGGLGLDAAGECRASTISYTLRGVIREGARSGRRR